jgi:hypothetical protein
VLQLVVFNDRDNAEDIVLEANYRTVAATAVTRVRLELKAQPPGQAAVLTTLDSATQPALFEVPVALTYTDTRGASHTVDGLRLKLGGAGLVPGLHRGRLIVFAPDYPGGLVWDQVEINVM